MSEKVVLAVYDLTQGMAKNMSMMLLGQQIDAVYHSAILVYGKEYFYGGGICQEEPEKTPYGKPIEKIDLGMTEIPKEVFDEYLKELAPKYSFDKYHII